MSKKIEPTNIEPTEIEPTKIEPTEIKPTEIKPLNPQKPKPKFSQGNAVTFFVLACIGAFATLFIGLTTGLTYYLWLDVVATAFAFIMFFRELKKMEITQEDLDKWNKQILTKHPSFNTNNLMKLEDTNKFLNKFSYWTHTFKFSFAKILACVMLPVAVLSVGAGIIVPAVNGGSIMGGDVAGYTYISDVKSSGNSEVVVVTAYKFENNNTYKLGYYDKETRKYTWTGTYNYTKSGSKVTVQNGYFTIKNGGKSLVDSTGGHWIRV